MRVLETNRLKLVVKAELKSTVNPELYTIMDEGKECHAIIVHSGGNLNYRFQELSEVFFAHVLFFNKENYGDVSLVIYNIYMYFLNLPVHTAS